MSDALKKELDERLVEATEQAYAEEGYVGGPIAVATLLAAAKFLAEIGVDERVVRAVADGNYGPAAVATLRGHDLERILVDLCRRCLRATHLIAIAPEHADKVAGIMATHGMSVQVNKTPTGAYLSEPISERATRPTRTPPSTPTTGS